MPVQFTTDSLPINPGERHVPKVDNLKAKKSIRFFRVKVTLRGKKQ